MLAEQCHHQEWTAQIRICQSRLAGMSITSWCSCHGIKEVNYYYWLSRVKHACLETIQYKMPVQQIVPIQPGLLQQQEQKDGSPQPCRSCQRFLWRYIMLNDATCSKAVYIVYGYTDLWSEMSRLAMLVEAQTRNRPYMQIPFIFCGRRTDRIKGLVWEEDR